VGERQLIHKVKLIMQESVL